jgi:hypothetical protein
MLRSSHVHNRNARVLHEWLEGIHLQSLWQKTCPISAVVYIGASVAPRRVAKFNDKGHGEKQKAA